MKYFLVSVALAALAMVLLFSWAAAWFFLFQTVGLNPDVGVLAGVASLFVFGEVWSRWDRRVAVREAAAFEAQRAADNARWWEEHRRHEATRLATYER